MAFESTLSIAIKALVEGIDEVRSLVQELQNIATAQEDVEDASGGAKKGNDEVTQSSEEAAEATKKQAKETDELNEKMDKLGGFLKKAGLAWLGYLGIDSAKHLADEAASSQELSNSLLILGNAAGIAKEQMEGLVESVRQMGLSENAATEGLIKLTKAGIDLTSTTEQGLNNAQRLAKVAQDIAAVSGKDTREVFNSINRSIEIGNTRLLRQLGIKIDQQAAEEKYLATLRDGTVVLNEQQKAQATANAILDAGVQIAGAYQASLNTAAGAMRELKKQTDDLVDILGAQLLPAYKLILDTLIAVSKAFQDIVTGSDRSAETLKIIGDTVKGAFDAVTNLVVDIIKFFAEMAEVAALVLIPLGDAVKLLAEFASLIIKNTVLLDGLKISAGIIGFIVAGLVDGFQLIYAGILLVSTALARLTGDLFNTAEATDKIAKDILNGFTKGESAVQKYMAAIDAAATKSTKIAPPADQFDEFEKRIEAVNEQLREGDITAEAAAKSLQKIREEMGMVKNVTEALTKSMQALDARVDTLTGRIQKEYLAALKALNIAPEQLTGGIDRATAAIVQNFKKVIDNAPATQQALNKAFELNIDAIKNFDALQGTLEAVRLKLIKTFGDGGVVSREFQQTLDLTKRKFDEILPSMLKVADTDEEFKKLEEQIKKFGEQGALSVVAVADALEQLKLRQDEFSREFGKADIVTPLKNLGLTIREVETEISESALRVGQSLDTIAKAAKLTGDQFQKVFGKGLETARTINDLKAFKASIDDATRSGVVGFEDLRNATDKLALKFDDLFQAQLKSARTKGDFEELQKSIIALGNSGVLTAQQVSNALKDITDKARGFNEEIVRIARQTAEVAQQRLAIIREQVAEEGKVGEIKNQQLKLEDDINKARETGSEKARAQVVADKEQLNLLEKERNLHALKAREEQANMDLLIAKQDELNALRAVELDPTNSARKASLQAAQDEVALREEVVAQIQTAVANEEIMVERTRQVAAEAQRVADSFEEASASMQRTFTVGESGNGVIEKLTAAGLDFGQAMLFADKYLKQVNGSITDFYKAIQGKTTFLFLGDWFRALRNANDELARTLELLQIENEAADRAAKAYAEAASEAERAAEAMVNGGTAMKEVTVGGERLAEVFRQIRRDAEGVVKAAQDAATGFLDRVLGIRVELLRQQGKEIEATKIEFEQRRKSLALEEKLLEIKIRAAQLTAKAAGLKDEAADLEVFLKQVRDGFKQADADLAELERLALDRLQKEEKERQRQNSDRLKAEKDINAEKLRGLDVTREAGEEAAAAAGASASAFARANEAIEKAAQSSLDVIRGVQVAGAVAPLQDRTVRQVAQQQPNVVNNTFNNTIAVDGKDLLSEDQLRTKIGPWLEKVTRRNT